MKAIFPASIDGDLLRLVHLTNGFRLIKGASPLKAGDVCQTEARIASVMNTDAGKVVKVKGHVLRDGQHVIEVVSSFLYHGRFDDFHNTFEVIEEPDYPSSSLTMPLSEYSSQRNGSSGTMRRSRFNLASLSSFGSYISQ